MAKIVKVKAGQDIIADKVIYADTYKLRRKGVLGKDKLEANEGALFVLPRRTGLSLFHSIHMFGVPFELAVAWLDRNRQILHLVLAKPDRIYFPPGFFTDTTHILVTCPHYLYHSLC